MEQKWNGIVIPVPLTAAMISTVMVLNIWIVCSVAHWFAFEDSVVRMSLQLSEKHFEEEPCEFEDAA